MVYSVHVWPIINWPHHDDINNSGPVVRGVFRDLNKAKAWGEQQAKGALFGEDDTLMASAYKTARWYDASGVVSAFSGLGDKDTGITVIRIYHDTVEE